MTEEKPQEIITPRFEGINPDLQDVADKLEVALEELDGFPGEQGYEYSDGEVFFDLSGLSEEEVIRVQQRIDQTTELHDKFTFALGAKVNEDETETTVLSITINQ